MRLLFSGIAAAAMLSSQLAVAATQCARPADQTAFEVEGLKSELMVTALSCGAQDKYNAFINRYQADLQAQEKALNVYFRRAFGRSAQKAHDDYITQLANVQSQEGLKAGTAFCSNFVSMFDEVQSLHNGSELADYVRSKDVVQPISFESCDASDHPSGVARIRQIRATRILHHHARKEHS